MEFNNERQVPLRDPNKIYPKDKSYRRYIFIALPIIVILFFVVGITFYRSKENPVVVVTPTPMVTIGTTATIPAWTWVTVLKPIQNGNVSFYKGDPCGVAYGGTIVVEEIDGPNLLVLYTAPNEETNGTQCPSHTEYMISRATFVTLTRQYVAIAHAIRMQKDLVKSLLDQNSFGNVSKAGNWHWVTVVNLTPIANGNVSFSFGDQCGVGQATDGSLQGGTIQVRGTSQGKTLYEYTTKDNAFGTICPTGTLFFD